MRRTPVESHLAEYTAFDPSALAEPQPRRYQEIAAGSLDSHVIRARESCPARTLMTNHAVETSGLRGSVLTEAERFSLAARPYRRERRVEILARVIPGEGEAGAAQTPSPARRQP